MVSAVERALLAKQERQALARHHCRRWLVSIRFVPKQYDLRMHHFFVPAGSTAAAWALCWRQWRCAKEVLEVHVAAVRRLRNVIAGARQELPRSAATTAVCPTAAFPGEPYRRLRRSAFQTNVWRRASLHSHGSVAAFSLAGDEIRQPAARCLCRPMVGYRRRVGQPSTECARLPLPAVSVAVLFVPCARAHLDASCHFGSMMSQSLSILLLCWI